MIFPHGDPHLLGNGSPQKPVDSVRTFMKNLAEGLKLVRFGGGGEITRFVCGYLSCEPRLSEVFLAGLPTMLKVHVANDPSGQWLENSIRFSVDEANGSNAGSGLVLAKLSELLFVETLRRYINAPPPLKVGAEILQSTEESVAEVAAAVGYGSEAAFNRAFKREFAYPPAQFRRKRRVPSAERS